MDVKLALSLILKESILLTGLVVFVLFANYPAISYQMLHPEAVPAYLINSKITSFSDLLAVYLHPQMLYPGGIPYFRPTNNFLIPQFITLFISWHNLKGFLIFNLLFLALSGYLMIKIYNRLFPKFEIGGYVAFGLYMMHPALIMNHLMIMQFDFCFVFFTLTSLYLFILFCQKNYYLFTPKFDSNLSPQYDIQKIKFHYLYLFFAALFFYVFSITLKEIAIMMAASMICYFLILFDNNQSGFAYLRDVFRNKQIRRLFFLLSTCAILSTLYITVTWRYVTNPALNVPFIKNVSYYSQILLGILENQTSRDLWSGIYKIHFPLFSRFIVWTFLLLLVVATIKLIKISSSEFIIKQYKKSLSFLFFSAGIFLLLPLFCGGWAWHLNLTLVFLSIAMGFSFEFVSRFYLSRTKNFTIIWGEIVASLLGLSLIPVIYAHTENSALYPQLLISLNRNAILEPPDLKNKFTAHSVLIVEDSKPYGWFTFGDAFYLFKTEKELAKYQNGYFYKANHFYNGTLFRWAYLMPELKEQVHPFKIDKMQMVADDVIYKWLENFNDIFCVGYDEQSHWHDLTDRFKANLLKEKNLRGIR